jgi:hypothetical protein
MQFGAYKTVRELGSGSTATIFLAVDAAGEAGKPRFAVKLCTAGAGIDSEWQSEKAREAASQRVWDFLASTTRQKRAHAAGARQVAPIHDGGTSEQGPWFATDYYPRTAQKLIEGHVTLTCEALHHILQCVVRGALEYKAHTGESHGNIKPSNVLLGSQRKLDEASVVLCDPFASKTEQVSNLELADLRAIGELLYQLVRRRSDVSGAEHWPIETSHDWTTVFGDQAPQWLALCNQLLDPNIWQTPFNLEALDQQLARLKPKESGAWLKMAAMIVVLGLLAGGSWWGWQAFGGVKVTRQIKKFQQAVGTVESAFQSKDYPSYFEAVKSAANLIPSAPKVREMVRPELQKLAEIEAKIGEEFQAAMKAGLAAQGNKDYQQALALAEAALKIRDQDPAAAKLRKEAQDQIDLRIAALAQQQAYETAMKAGLTAQGNKDFRQALAQAEAALKIRAQDPAAMKLKREAQDQIDVMAATLMQQQAYETAMKAAGTAQANKDYQLALAQAEAALKIRDSDPGALKLKKEAQDQIDLLVATRMKEQAYDAAMRAGLAAQGNKDHQQALAQAEAALKIKGGDLPALKLKKEAQDQISLLAITLTQQQAYETAMKAGLAAQGSKDYQQAVVQAGAALKIKDKDPAALKLRKESQDELDRLAAALMQQQAYETAMKAGLTAQGNKDYQQALAQAEAALKNRERDPAALKLKKEAQDQIDLLAARLKNEQAYEAAMKAGVAAQGNKDYQQALAQAEAALKIKDKDPAALKLKKEAQDQIDLLAAALKNEQAYQAAMKAGTAAQGNKDYQQALAQAEVALKIKDKDIAASKLKQDAQGQLNLLAAALKQQQARDAVKAGQMALERTELRLAIEKANEALTLDPGQVEAKKLLTDADAALNLQKLLETYDAQLYACALEIGQPGALKGITPALKNVTASKNIKSDNLRSLKNDRLPKLLANYEAWAVKAKPARRKTDEEWNARKIVINSLNNAINEIEANRSFRN